MAKTAMKPADMMVEVSEIKFAKAAFCCLGTTPLIMNRFAFKAWQELLLPSGRKNRASLEQTLKHDPLAEFQSSVYRTSIASKAMFHFPTGAFHKAIAQAAIDLPGVKRAQIERLSKVTSVNIELYGVPQLFMAMVRNSDISHTPDVRTRAIFPQWACTIDVAWVSAIITQRSIAHLVAAAGMIVGVGDWRSEKGGSYGAFATVGEDDKQFLDIIKKQGRSAQQEAFNDPVPYDVDTAEIYSWFQAEVKRREKDHLGTPEPMPKVRMHVEAGTAGDAEYTGFEEVE